MPRNVLQTVIFLFSEVYVCSYCAEYDTQIHPKVRKQKVSCWFHAGFMPVSGQMPPIVVNNRSSAVPRNVLQTVIFLFSEVYVCSYCAKYATQIQSKVCKQRVSCWFHAGLMHVSGLIQPIVVNWSSAMPRNVFRSVVFLFSEGGCSFLFRQDKCSCSVSYWFHAGSCATFGVFDNSICILSVST